MEIDDPVEDAKGYVYERHDVVFYINSNHGSVKCPSTGKCSIYCFVLSKLVRQCGFHRDSSMLQLSIMLSFGCSCSYTTYDHDT